MANRPTLSKVVWVNEIKVGTNNVASLFVGLYPGKADPLAVRYQEAGPL